MLLSPSALQTFLSFSACLLSHKRLAKSRIYPAETKSLNDTPFYRASIVQTRALTLLP